MKKAIRKFSVVPSFRKGVIATVGAASLVAASSSFAAGIADGATAAIASAQTSGEGVGAAVVACVAALCVVGVVIALIRKV